MLFFLTLASAQTSTKKNIQIIKVEKTATNIVIDGIGDDSIWQITE